MIDGKIINMQKKKEKEYLKMLSKTDQFSKNFEFDQFLKRGKRLY